MPSFSGGARLRPENLLPEKALVQEILRSSPSMTPFPHLTPPAAAAGRHRPIAGGSAYRRRSAPCMGEPAHRATEREDAGEGVRREAERFQQQRRVELDIGLERPVRFALAQDGER